jgi:hypothetical protein
MKFGLMYDDEVVEVFIPPAGRTINDVMTDERAAEYMSIPDHVTVGYKLNMDGTWLPPEDNTPAPA